jgi:23S rRNA (uracil1939-C5)-methyltransferase
VTADQRELDIVALGAQGDGVASGPNGLIYVRGGLPGERVVATIDGDRAEIAHIVTASADRRAPPCPAFGRCGGCSAQHLDVEAYRRWKHGLVVEALQQRQLDAHVLPLVPVAERTRRRTVLAARRTRKTVLLGYHGARSHDVVDIEGCLVLEPAIERALPQLRALAGEIASRRGELRITVTATVAGLDVAIEGVAGTLDAVMRQRLAETARTASLARLTVDGDTIAILAAPTLSVGRARVTPPPSAFLQAVRACEQSLQSRVLTALDDVPDRARVADLFCGIGTFALPIAERHRVEAYDSAGSALRALEMAAHATQGLKPIEARVRDLFRDPLPPKLLDGYAAVVLDPPRAGAQAQVHELAHSGVRRVVMVSCNPTTFARDARCLVDAGYTLEPVTPIDQFLYTSHVELLAVFQRSD